MQDRAESGCTLLLLDHGPSGSRAQVSEVLGPWPSLAVLLGEACGEQPDHVHRSSNALSW